MIRPPSEWCSLLIRVTRGCGWGRCRFCGIYPGMGQPEFSTRSAADVCRDIDLLRQRLARVKSAFLGDSDPLCVPLQDSLAILQYLRQRFPEIHRVTCYARTATLWKLGQTGLCALAKAGLNRIHIGLESGDTETLRFHFKGQSPKMAIETSAWLRQTGIEISYYVLLGLGGRDNWKHHIDETARVLNLTNPGFIRLRRLWIYTAQEIPLRIESPLMPFVRSGRFVPQTPEGTVLELRCLIEQLEGIASQLVCDHGNNYVHVEGRLPGDKQRMLDEIDRFLCLPDHEKARVYAQGSVI